MATPNSKNCKPETCIAHEICDFHVLDFSKTDNSCSVRCIKFRAALKKITDANELLRSALIGLVGTDDKNDLECMEVATRSAMSNNVVPKTDAVNMINAIDAILQTRP